MVWSLADLEAQVYTETNRPDLVDETKGSIIAATLQAHGIDYWYRDVAVGQVVFDFSAYVQQLDLSILPRYKALSLFRKFDPTLNNYQLNPGILPPLQSNSLGVSLNPELAMRPITIIDPNDLLDEQYRTEKVDVGYLAGTVLNIKSSTQFQYGLVSFYQYPEIDKENNYVGYNSWVANEHPFLIVYLAAQMVFRKTGQLDIANTYGVIGDTHNPPTGPIGVEIGILRATAITAEGR